MIKIKKLDYERMVNEIDDLVGTDFAFNMVNELYMDTRRYTQVEAEKMAEILDQVYQISHRVHCKACQGKYLI